MQIRIKATGRLEFYLSAETKESGRLPVPDDSTLQDIIQLLSIDNDARFLCTVNAIMVPQSQFDKTIIKNNDEIIFVPPIRGG